MKVQKNCHKIGYFDIFLTENVEMSIKKREQKNINAHITAPAATVHV